METVGIEQAMCTLNRWSSTAVMTPCLVLSIVWQLGVFNGDAVLLKGKKRKDTVCIALVEEGLEDTTIRMSKV